MEEMLKSKWSGRVWVGVSKESLSGTRTMPAARSVSSIICRTLEAFSKEEQAINKSSTYNSVQRHCWTLHAVAAKSCCYNGHDARPNPTLDELVHPSGNAAWLNSTT